MNAVSIARVLAEKRREKGMTQEELASYIGVSKAAVSKWEKEQSYPDIVLLPQLAAFFNISVDDLLGYSPQLCKEDIWKLCKRLSSDFSRKPFDEVLAECREISRKYYSCFPLLYHMALTYVNHHALIADKEAQRIPLNEAKELCRRVIRESGDAMLSKDALLLQALCALVLEEPAEIFESLGESVRPQGDLTESDLIAQAFMLVGNNKKAVAVSQCGMYGHLMSLLNSMVPHIWFEGCGFKASELTFQRALELMRLFNVRELDWNVSGKIYIAGAIMYCKNGKPDLALEQLEMFADLCKDLSMPVKYRGDDFFTEVENWLADEFYAVLPFDERMIKENMLLSLTAVPEIENTLKDEPRYQRIVERLREFCNK